MNSLDILLLELQVSLVVYQQSLTRPCMNLHWAAKICPYIMKRLE